MGLLSSFIDSVHQTNQEDLLRKARSYCSDSEVRKIIENIDTSRLMDLYNIWMYKTELVNLLVFNRPYQPLIKRIIVYSELSDFHGEHTRELAATYCKDRETLIKAHIRERTERIKKVIESSWKINGFYPTNITEDSEYQKFFNEFVSDVTYRIVERDNQKRSWDSGNNRLGIVNRLDLSRRPYSELVKEPLVKQKIIAYCRGDIKLYELRDYLLRTSY